MLGESKYFGSGQSLTTVPVRVSFIFSERNLVFSSPPSKTIEYFSLFLKTTTSQRFDSAFDTATPTPCRPPGMWYTAAPERENLPPAVSMGKEAWTACTF